MTEEAKASGNALDTPTSVWSEMAREQAEPHINRRKQMTTDASRLMRLSTAAQWSSSASRQHSSIAKWYSGRVRSFAVPRVASR
jgi:hypothetical protein